MRLIRGWESRYLPTTTGGLRLCTAHLYRAIGEEEGLGDRREGEIRVGQENILLNWETDILPVVLGSLPGENLQGATTEEVRARLSEALDDPEIEVKQTGSGAWRISQNIKIDDSALVSPFLFCLSREPTTRDEWERLREALPLRYDTWTVTDDLNSLYFEIECGIKRWMGLNEITQHSLLRNKAWVSYSYFTIPASGSISDAGNLARWFQKRKQYSDQREYRYAWLLRTPQWEELPSYIDIELTRTGLALLKPWEPPA